MDSLSTLISNLDLLLSRNIDEDAIRCPMIAQRLRRFLRADWLPLETEVRSPLYYQRHPLYEDPAGRFCVGSYGKKHRFTIIPAGAPSE